MTLVMDGHLSWHLHGKLLLIVIRGVSPMAQETWVQSQVASYQTLKMVLDTSLLNTQQYMVRIKGNVEQSRERSSALPYTSV